MDLAAIYKEKNCPYCKKSGKLDKWYNHYTDEENEEDCPACEGTGICEDQLMLDHAEANLEPEEHISHGQYRILHHIVSFY